MDPIAHTLVGSALAQTGLARKTRLGAAALIIGANLPDIDGLAYFWGGDAGLHFRRGWTHGLPAVVWRIFGSFTNVSRSRLAIAALAATTVYIGLMVSSARYGRQVVVRELSRQGIHVEDLMVGPVPVNPFVRDVVVATPNAYKHGKLELFPSAALSLEPHEIPRPRNPRFMDGILADTSVRGFKTWMRFPFLELEESPSGCIVHVMDARYTRQRSRGFGSVTVPTRNPCPAF